MHHLDHLDYLDHLADRSASQLTLMDISALIRKAKEYGTPALMLLADKGCVTSVHPSGIESAQGMTGVVAVGNVAWLRVAGSPPGVGGAESPNWIISTQPGAAWCGFQAWAAAMSNGVGVPPQSFPIFGKHATEFTAPDVLLLQEYAAGTGHTAIEVGVDADCIVTGISFVDADPAAVASGRYGCIVMGREVDSLLAWTFLLRKALNTSQGKG